MEEKSALTEAVFLILHSMLEPRHGYSVMQHIGRITRGRVILGAGTLYGAINTLLNKGWIESVSEDGDARKKIYQTTELGRDALWSDVARIEELLRIVENAREDVILRRENERSSSTSKKKKNG